MYVVQILHTPLVLVTYFVDYLPETRPLSQQPAPERPDE
jgi:hypothetical protein